MKFDVFPTFTGDSTQNAIHSLLQGNHYLGIAASLSGLNYEE